MLLEIPYGEVVTYGDIAKKIALKTGKAKMAPRAVGGAVGKKPDFHNNSLPPGCRCRW